MERFAALYRSTRAGETVGLYRRGRRRFRIDVCEQCGVFEGLAADRSQRVARDGQFGQLRPVGERTRTDRHDRFRNGQVFDRVVRCESIVADGGEACTELERSDIGVVAEGSVTQRGNVVGQGECRQAAVGESTIAEGRHTGAQCQGRQFGAAVESARTDRFDRLGDGDGRDRSTACEHFGRDGRCRTEGNGREFGTVAEALLSECRGVDFRRGETRAGERFDSDAVYRGEVGIRKGGATLERFVADGFDTRRQGESRQRRTLFERAFADSADSGRNGRLGQGRAAFEGSGCDRGRIFEEFDRAQFGVAGQSCRELRGFEFRHVQIECHGSGLCRDFGDDGIELAGGKGCIVAYGAHIQCGECRGQGRNPVGLARSTIVDAVRQLLVVDVLQRISLRGYVRPGRFIGIVGRSRNIEDFCTFHFAAGAAESGVSQRGRILGPAGNGLQIACRNEGVASDRGHLFAQIDRGDVGTVPEGVIGDRGDIDNNAGEGAATAERALVERFQRFGEGYVLQLAAVVEGVVADSLQLGGHIDCREGRTCVAQVGRNCSQCIGKLYAFQ